MFEDVPSTDLRRMNSNPTASRSWICWCAPRAAPSKSEARRLVQGGGVYVNNRRVTDPQARLSRTEAIGGRVFVLRKGQKQQFWCG